jgi:hypothetical protein
VYEEVVNPCTNDLKALMVHYNITNEAELFCSNLTFRMNDALGSKYIGDPSRKEEDAVKELTDKLE